ncbi:carbohydrate ABC transporter permease [Oryzicola mucosus]|uniref:Carbohydrate ABC transporter permease n=1 Tax=Oryzicola mucosus TaxID=2767425 RepID=A0A8J6PX55_9HYPH|nr:carbohydrate ABC transporter permease [Oryzicola mucosus]MBD0416791.1 carbohydrate ABC transporter permease [Oryzicola mucosus]
MDETRSPGEGGWGWLATALTYAVALVISLPFLWMLKTATESSAASTAFPPNLLPDGGFFETFETIFFNSKLLLWLWNSFVVSAVSTLLALALAIPAAYALSRFRFWGKSGVSVAILSAQMMPPIVLIIPLYTFFIRFGLADSLWSVIIANAAFALPVIVWMLKTSFDTVPFEIDEAARVDGASWFHISLLIVVPLALPGVIAASIFAFLNSWDEFLLARTLLRSVDQWVGTIGLSSFMGENATPWNEVMAIALAFTVPPVALFLFIQKHFVSGLGSGAVKG